MRKILILICMVVVAFLFVGCGKSTTSSDNGDTSINTDSDGQQTVMEVEDDEGNTVKVTASGTDSDEWCQEGAKWEMAGADANANMVIEGIVNSGKYEGYCHVKYDMQSDEGQTSMDLYFDQEGSGYQVMDVNGQNYESEWSS